MCHKDLYVYKMPARLSVCLVLCFVRSGRKRVAFLTPHMMRRLKVCSEPNVQRKIRKWGVWREILGLLMWAWREVKPWTNVVFFFFIGYLILSFKLFITLMFGPAPIEDRWQLAYKKINVFSVDFWKIHKYYTRA